MGSLSEQRGQGGAWAGGVLLGNTYLLGQRISLGGMGEVFEATHARLPGRYAVKILRPELLGNREAFARFCREAEVMSELRHPNVVQIYDFNTTPDGRPYFVMEHLEGRDLEARLTQSGPMPLPAAVRVVEAVASALAIAHAHGIVHRDLKPANIFLVAIDGQVDELVKVLDFGISKIRSEGTLLSTPTDMIGSPAYMSPEQARGADEIDGRSDQFALGAITYRMLTGSDPFRGGDIASLLYQVVHEEAPRLAQRLPAWWDTRALQAVLDRALAKDPEQRFSGMMEMARAFEAASEQTLSHEMVERGTVNLGATLIAAPPPPPLRPVRTPAPAGARRAGPGAGSEDRAEVEPGEIEDSPPPIRTPAPEPMEPLEPIRAVPRRPHPGLELGIDDGRTVPNGSPPRGPAWEEPYIRDQLPVTHHRVALAVLALLALAGILFVTGLYRHLIAGGRHVLGLADRVETPSPPPAPVNAAPVVESPAAARPPADETTAPAEGPATAKPPPSEPTTPARPSTAAEERPAPAAHPHHHHHYLSEEPRIINRPGSVYLPSRPPPPAGAAPQPDTLQNQFSIPPPAPTEDSPAHDLVPPPAPEREPGPEVTPAPATNSPAGPPAAPRARGPADQPMGPSF